MGNFNNWIEGFAIHDYELFTGGWFTNANGTAAGRIARLDSAASGIVLGQWGIADTSDPTTIDWPGTWYGEHNLRAQWFKILAKKPTEWNYLDHVKGEPQVSTYYVYKFKDPLPAGTKLLFEGDFPHCRMFDIQVGPPWSHEQPAIGDGSGIPEVPILDQDIEPDPGHVNPFRPGADRNAPNRHYHVTYELRDGNAVDWNPSAMRPPYRRPGNLRYGGRRAGNKGDIDRGPYIFIRVYMPDHLEPFAGVEPPVLGVQLPGEEPELAPVCQAMELNLQDLLPPYELEDNPALADGTSVKENEANQELRNRAQFDLDKPVLPATISPSSAAPS